MRNHQEKVFTLFSIDNILLNYQLSPHQLYEKSPKQKYLPLIDRRDPRDKIFDRGIRTFHGKEKKRIIMISIYGSQHRHVTARLFKSIIVSH